MKFVEKKCPNCGANLKIDPDKRNARCDSCRREFIIEYDASDLAGDAKEIADKIKAESVNLVPAAKIFGAVFAVHSIIIIVITVIIFAVVSVGIISAINTFNSINDNIRTQTDSQSSQSQEDAMEQFERNKEQMQKELKRAQEEFENNTD